MKRVVHPPSTFQFRPSPDYELRSGEPAAHRGCCLPLLPSGPDGVHKPRLRRTWPSTPFNRVGTPNWKPWAGIRLRF